MASERPYKKLAGIGDTASGRHRLWLGDDHLLYVSNERISETYKRFYFDNIKYIEIRKTAGLALWNWIFGVLSGLCILPVLFIAADSGMREMGAVVGFSIPTAFFLICLLINTALGPKCKTFICTMAHTKELPSLHRVRTARKVIAILRPHIASAQGEFTPEHSEAYQNAWLEWAKG